MKALTLTEKALIHPHLVYKFKCGQTVSFRGFEYMFMGYHSNVKMCVLADRHGSKCEAFLTEIIK